MRRLLIIVLLLFAALPSFAQTDLTVTINQNAIVRSGPDTSFEQLTVAARGSQMRLDGRNENGNWVRGITSREVIGWVSSGTLNITLGQLNGLRQVTVDTPFSLTAPVGEAAPPAEAPPTAEEEAPAAEPPAPQTTGEGGTGIGVVATADVNVRTGPDTSYRRIDGVDTGNPFNIDGRDASGGWVRGITQSGNVGWVFATYLSISPEDVNTLPVVEIDAPFSLAAPGGGPAPQAPAEEDTPAEDTAAPEAPPAPPITSTAPVSGFSYGGHVQGFGPEAVNWMNVAGMTWVKKQFRYTDGQNAGAAAGMINEAHSKGFRILIGVVGSPSQLGASGYNERYASFVAGVAGLGADAIEIWNEPNIDREWPAGQIDPAAYTRLLQASYNAIKGTNSNTLVISGAPAPTGFFGGCSGNGCDDDAFLAGMAAAGAANYMDCVGVHYNEGIVPPTQSSGDPRGNSGHYTRYLQPMMNVYSGAFGGRVPLCFTELGYLSPEGYGPLSPGFAWASNVTVAQQAAWLDQAVNISARSGRVRLLIVWNVDFTNYGIDPMAGYAMIRPGGGCPACEALGS